METKTLDVTKAEVTHILFIWHRINALNSSCLGCCIHEMQTRANLEKNCMFWEHYLKSEIKSSGPNVLLGFSILSEIITNKLYIRKKKEKRFFYF